MQAPPMSAREFWKAVGLGLVNAVLLSLIMVPAFALGLSPMPRPPSQAFAETLFGTSVPMPVGLLFHVAYVTGWSVVYMGWFRERASFSTALWLAVFLWAVILVVFFPIVGWGFFGLGVGPALIPASAVPHLLFAVFLWALSRWGFRRGSGVT